jgi:hypothetical protein
MDSEYAPCSNVLSLVLSQQLQFNIFASEIWSWSDQSHSDFGLIGKNSRDQGFPPGGLRAVAGWGSVVIWPMFLNPHPTLRRALVKQLLSTFSALCFRILIIEFLIHRSLSPLVLLENRLMVSPIPFLPYPSLTNPSTIDCRLSLPWLFNYCYIDG